MKIIKSALFSLTALGLLSITGCGSSGSSGGASGASVGFSIPSGVDVLKVDAQGSSSYDDSGTDYSKASQSFHVSHPVGEALASTSQIMCFLGQLGIGNMWKETSLPRVYLVGVDQGKCDASSNNQPSQSASSGGGGDSSQGATQLTMVTVRLSREAPGLYPRAEVWFEQVDNGQIGEIHASVDVLAEPSALHPYGTFNLYYKQYNGGVAYTSGNLLVSGNSAAPIAFTFFEGGTHGSDVEMRSASVEMDADGGNLKAAVQSNSTNDGNSAWVVASSGSKIKANDKKAGGASADNVTQVDLTAGQCLRTDQFKYRIYGYGLFDEATGAKVNLQTGVQCNYTDSHGKVRNCNIGSNGAWFEPDSTGADHNFVNGDHVIRRAWGDNAAHDGEQLTLFVADGKLTRYKVKKFTLAEIHGLNFQYFDNNSGNNYIVKYLNAGESGVGSNGFYEVASMTWSNGGPPTTTNLGSPVDITPASNQYMWLYSDALGGVSFIGGKTTVTARLQENVSPDDAALASGHMDLKCLNQCPKTAAPISQSDLNTWGGPFQADPDQTDMSTAIHYTFTKTDMALHANYFASIGSVVALAGGASFQSSTAYQFGLQTGALVDSTQAGTPNGFYDTDGNTYYQYGLGANTFDKLVIAMDSGNHPIHFDNPIPFDYTHSQANDRNDDATYAGQKFLLRFQGDDHFDGFPWEQVDRDGDGQPDMWFPLVSLKDNIQLVDGASNHYRIKALYGDLTLNPTACGSGFNLHLPATAVPSAVSGSPSNANTTKPDYGSCQYDTVTETASAGCD